MRLAQALSRRISFALQSSADGGFRHSDSLCNLFSAFFVGVIPILSIFAPRLGDYISF